MNEDFKVWASNEEEISELLLWSKRNDYHFYYSGDSISYQSIRCIVKNTYSCGFILFNKTKKICVSPIGERSYFRESCPHGMKEFTFEEFKKLYLEENKMEERKVSNYDTMPELKSGMFVEVQPKNKDSIFGVVVDGKVVYENGGFDWVRVWNKNMPRAGYILAVYESYEYGFNYIKNHKEETCVWKYGTCIEISKKEIIEKFDLIDSEYCQIVVSELPPKNYMPNFKNGLFVHSISEGWGVVVDERVIFRYIYGHAGVFMPDDIDAINENAECFEDCKREPTWNVINWIPESKFRKQFNIPENYDFKIVD